MTDALPPLTSLAVIAGGGVFPGLVAREASASGIGVFGVCLEGHAEDDTLASYPRIFAKTERMGSIFAELRARRISDLVLIGRMTRPHILSLRPDWTTLCILPKLIPSLLFGGDDALLRTVRRVLEAQGFRLHAATSFIAHCVAGTGIMGRVAPDAAALQNIEAGIVAARAHGENDLGQAVVMHDGQLAGLEDVSGTDALIARTALRGAVLVKTAKPSQDRALDMPSIGLETLRLCAAQGYAGIAVEANATLMADKKQMVDFADTHGLFLIGIT